MPRQPQPEHATLRLIKRCKKGERAAQKELYQRYYAYAMSVTIRYMKNRNEAAEVMNDAFIKIFLHIDGFNTDLPFKPWLRRVLINESINAVKKRDILFREEQLDEISVYAQESNITSEISYAEIVEMIQKLPPQYQTVFNLHVIEGFTHEEIGDMLQIKPGTSKSNLFKAKEKLKIILREFLESDY